MFECDNKGIEEFLKKVDNFVVENIKNKFIFLNDQVFKMFDDKV